MLLHDSYKPHHFIRGRFILGLLFLIVPGLFVAYVDFEDVENYFSKDGIRKRITSVKGGYNNNVNNKYDGLIQSATTTTGEEWRGESNNNDKQVLPPPPLSGLEESGKQILEEITATTAKTIDSTKQNNLRSKSNNDKNAQNGVMVPSINPTETTTTTKYNDDEDSSEAANSSPPKYDASTNSSSESTATTTGSSDATLSFDTHVPTAWPTPEPTTPEPTTPMPTATEPTTAIPTTTEPTTALPTPKPTTMAVVPPKPTTTAVSPTTTIQEKDINENRPSEEQQQQQPASKCLNLRGQEGTWVPWEEGYDYVTPLRDPPPKANIYIKFKNTHKGNQDVPWPPTKWKWQDKHHEDCPIQLITKQGFCTVLQELGIQRIFLVGDSLTRMMSKSLWKLLDFTDDPGPTLNSTFIRSFSCGSGSGSASYPTTTAAATTPGNSNNNYTVEFDFFTQYRFVNDYDEPDSWFQYYSSNPAKTLLIINTGLHYAKPLHGGPQDKAYRSDTKLLFETITNLKRSTDDLVMFRTSVPGHKNCQQTTAPFKNSRKFQQHQDVKSQYDEYGWDKVDGFNRYVQENWFPQEAPPQPQQQENKGQVNHNKNWYLLDVYPMTLLRPDGHQRPPIDCLHYILPGPPDWWNHLLYSKLLDIAALTKNSKQQQQLLLPELSTPPPVVPTTQEVPSPIVKQVPGPPVPVSPVPTKQPSDTTELDVDNNRQSAEAQAATCLKLRGQEGGWVPWEEGYDYASPLHARRGSAYGRFKTKKGNEHLAYPVTKWMWQDNHCPIQLFTAEGFCSVLHRLAISRVFLIGDSLTHMMTQSMWKLLGNTDDTGFFDGINGNWSFPCSYQDKATDKRIQYTLDIEFRNKYHLTIETGKRTDEAIQRYSSNPTKTLLIFNSGLHYTAPGKNGEQQDQAYRENIDTFVETITNLNRQDDIVIFRTSVPGHKNCGQEQAPYPNIGQFQQHQQVKSEYDKYSWEKVDEFNHYVQEKWFNPNSPELGHQASGLKNWYLMDVYPMTVLRADGHQNPPGDCLHYGLPGPPDWWNNLLYSKLLDIADLSG